MRHNEGSNFEFLDGHVKWMKLNAVRRIGNKNLWDDTEN
ncbi:MAG: hypothetical protein HYU66_29620 [Armatimonadetes bacterium]|nr:hypothetical protein [Armatimonadota bacterium]